MQGQGGILGQRIEQLKNLLEQSWKSKDQIEKEKNSYAKRLSDISKDFDNLLQENKQQTCQLKEFKIRANQIIDQNMDDLRQKENVIGKLKEDMNSCKNQASKRENELQEVCDAYDNLEKRNLNTVEELQQAHQYIKELTSQMSSLTDQLKTQETGHPA